MTLINILDNVFGQEQPEVTLDRVRWVVYIQQEIRFEYINREKYGQVNKQGE